MVVETAAAKYGVAPELIARRAIEHGLHTALQELQDLRELADTWNVRT